MIAHRISRRRALQGAIGVVAAPLLSQRVSRAGQSDAPLVLEAQTSTIEVRGKAARVYSLAVAPSGQPGLGFIEGDAFRIRLSNRLSEPTLIHWHGLTPPSSQDGVPGLSQDPLPAGGSYDYDTVWSYVP